MAALCDYISRIVSEKGKVYFCKIKEGEMRLCAFACVCVTDTRKKTKKLINVMTHGRDRDESGMLQCSFLYLLKSIVITLCIKT